MEGMISSGDGGQQLTDWFPGCYLRIVAVFCRYWDSEEDYYIGGPFINTPLTPEASEAPDFSKRWLTRILHHHHLSPHCTAPAHPSRSPSPSWERAVASGKENLHSLENHLVHCLPSVTALTQLRWGPGLDQFSRGSARTSPGPRAMASSALLMEERTYLFTSQTLRVNMCQWRGMRWPTKCALCLQRTWRSRQWRWSSPTLHPVRSMRPGPDKWSAPSSAFKPWQNEEQTFGREGFWHKRGRTLAYGTIDS